MSDYGSGLFKQHADKLRSSRVSPEVAGERSYRSIEGRAQMGRHGFRGEQASLYPALLIPLRDVYGEPAGYQIRPDFPREVSGRLAKYETRAHERMVIDCHPRVCPVLRDPSKPLVITEGPIKGDALVSAGANALALLGVWNFRGKADLGGTTNLPELGDIVWQERDVLICFDSDVMKKKAVHDACEALAALLRRHGANVLFVYLPSHADLTKVGVDDWLHAGNKAPELWSLASPELRRIVDPAATTTPVDTFDDIPEEDGADVLDDVRTFLTNHVVFASEHQATASALWCAHTYGLDVFASTPRQNIFSPQKQSGKTRLLECEHLLCRDARLSANMSAAYLFRSVALYRPTLLIDELDTIFRPGDKNHEDLRALINAGHRPDAVVGRVEGDGATMAPKDYPVFCAVATAGIGLPPETVRDRGIDIRLRRRSSDERVKPFRHRTTVPQGQKLGRRLAAWMSRSLDELADAEPKMPEGIEDRAADVWEPLLAIADAAGGMWPSYARKAATHLHDDRHADADNEEMALLADLHTLITTGTRFGTRDRYSSEELCEALNQLVEAPWAELRTGLGINPRALAARLRHYDIHSKSVRIGTSTPKGYEREQFTEVWKRYPPPPDTSATSATAT